MAQPGIKNQECTVHLFGGLANQLFQIQYGFFLAEDGHPVNFDDFYVNQTANHGHNALKNLDWHSVSHVGIEFYRLKLKWAYARLISKIRSQFILKFLSISCDHRFNSDAKIHFGYFQKFEFKNETMSKMMEKVYQGERTIAEPYSAVHMRFGDYVGNRVYADLSSYYRLAVFRLLTNEMPLIVVTDEIDRARCLLGDLSSKVRFQSNTPELDLSTLLQAEHLAIANSSFSLLSGIYGQAQSILAPQFWFNKRLSDNVSYPQHWSILNED
jgi:hypothetical protein